MPNNLYNIHSDFCMQYFTRSHGHFEIKIYQTLCLPIDACLEVPVKKYIKGPKNEVYSPHIGGSDASKV